MNAFSILTITVGVLTSLLVKYLIEKWKLYQIKVPGPNLHPFLIEFFYGVYNGATLDFKERLQFLRRYSHTYDGMVKFWFGW